MAVVEVGGYLWLSRVVGDCAGGCPWSWPEAEGWPVSGVRCVEVALVRVVGRVETPRQWGACNTYLGRHLGVDASPWVVETSVTVLRGVGHVGV